MRDLSRFNENQLEAIKHREGPAAVIASAGSGKTASVVERILTLIDEDVDPSHIFACTFTKKAAEEMKMRLVREIGDKGEYVRVSTLHSFCYQLLKKYYARTKPGYKLNLVNNGQLWMYLGKLMKDEDTVIKDIKWFLGEVSRKKLNTISPQQYFDTEITEAQKSPNYPMDHTNDRKLCFHFLYKKYEAFLKTYSYIDYSDMLYKVYLIFKDPANEKFLSNLQDRIRYMMVDEFQDTNRISFYIYRRLIEKSNNIMVVGDPRQAIYSFQGADSSIISEFVETMGAKVIELPKNYRSSEVIVNHANMLISNSTELSDLTPTVPHKVGGESIKVMCTDDDVMEAMDVMEKIKEMASEGYAYKDMAILYRVHSQSLPLLDQFLVNKIPYKLYSNQSVFDRKELKVILSYLKAIAKPKELSKTGFWEIANNPLRYIKKASFEEIEDAYDSGLDESFWEALLEYDTALDYKQAKCVGNLVYDIRKGQKYFRGNSEATTRALIEFILHQLKVKDWFESSDGINAEIEGSSGDEDKELNLDVLLTMAEKYKNVEDFLLFVDGLSNKKTNDEDEEKRDAVHMLSLHRSKGLEFPIVFIIGMCSRTMPFYKAVEEGNVDEERRLAYVGVTRAEKRLFISNIKGRLGRFHVEPSFFMHELGLVNDKKILTDRR